MAQGVASGLIMHTPVEGNEYGWNDGSSVSREAHAGFCEKLRVKFPRLTHPRLGFKPISVIAFWSHKVCDLKDREVEDIIDEVTQAVADWARFARDCGVGSASRSRIAKALASAAL